MAKIFGIDLGTNSIGFSDRDTENGKNLKEQLDYFSSVIFKSGVQKKNNCYESYAAERTRKRSTRRLYQSRKYRIWETLKVLIDFGYCPLSKEDLEKWSCYDKSRGLKRQYPIDAEQFEQWVRLDFNGDGTADYTSPYQLRADLMERQFDFEKETDRFKFGRALYHIAQRRGFRSSKGETIKEQESEETDNAIDTEIDVSAELKKSEAKKSKDLVTYMNEYKLPTIGCAFAHLEKSGIRVRNSVYQPVRSQYKDEIQKIFEFQNGLDVNSDFYKRIMSEKKSEGSIFYKRPLRSQKGLVGKCTLEKNKSRCPISHPEFEKFRAWCFINNIKYRVNDTDNWLTLSVEEKAKLYHDKFMRTASSFKFEEIRKWMIKELGITLDYKAKTINYKDNTNVSGCPISGRLKNLFGEDWETVVIESSKERVNKKTGEIHKVKYNAESLWHICFSFDDAEYVEEFAKTELKYDDKKVKELVRLWGAIPQGYGMLSLKSIKAINRFLQKGLIYTDATLLAKLPEIFGEELWAKYEAKISNEIGLLSEQNRNEKQVLKIANNLIANYKSLEYDEETQCYGRFADHNPDYKLDDSDLRDVENYSKEKYGKETWKAMSDDEKKTILNKVATLYQDFFSSKKRDYFHIPKLGDSLKKYLSDNFDFLHCPNNFRDKNNAEQPCHCEACKKLNQLYHPSMIEFYAPAKDVNVDGRYLKLLGSPVIGALKNPMAMRVLHILRKQMNALLSNNVVNEDTHIVVETARDLNDANMRWAIEQYQREREAENKEFAEAIKRHFPERIVSDDDIDKARLFVEQCGLLEKGVENEQDKTRKNKKKTNEKVEAYKKDITKYRLWIEQGCRCIYTGRMINITSLFDDNSVDFEHTIPRSQSFDNSLANLTICDAHFNRTIKKNQIPAQLSNYDEILQRIQPWIEKVEQLKDNVEFWKGQSKRAQDKDRKDYCIRQRHLWKMELDYWQDKVSRFTMKEVTSGFRHSQLSDTRIITKYAYHYLKTVFPNVEVQKGSVTADFRKMLGIQSIDEKKSRDKHSHHAIDATMLTLIPVAAKRDRMLELFYQIQEEKKLGNNTEKLEHDLEKEKKSCKIGNVSDIGKFIEENIFINHISKDQTLTPANKRSRVRGKVKPLLDNNKNIIYERNADGSLKYRLYPDGTPIYKRDENGEFLLDNNNNKILIPIPKAEFKTGDCIRGQLHGDTFYGAITQAQKDENGKLLRDDNGKLKIGEQIYYVVRRELKYKENSRDSGFKTWEEIEKVIVNKSLITKMKKQFPEGTSFKDACRDGIYMLDKNDKKVNRIRHIRCYSIVKNPLIVKKQTYLSTKDYKQNYYAEMGKLYVLCKYENEDKSNREFRIWSLFDISKNRKNGIEDIPKTIISKGKKKETLKLSQILKEGDMLLVYKDDISELQDMDKKELSNRLYVIRGFENDGCRIVLQINTNAQQLSLLGKGESVKDFSIMPEKIRCSINKINYLIKGVDYEMSPKNEIIFRHKL